MDVASFHHWLPDSALQGSTLDAELCEVVRLWSQRWFAKIPWRTQSSLAIIAQPSTDHAVRLGDSIMLGVSAAAHDALAGAMLDYTIIANELTQADRRLVTGLVQTCVLDLANALAGLLGLPANATWGDAQAEDSSVLRARACAIAGEPRRASLHLAIGLDAMIAFAKRRSRAGRLPEAFTSLDTALGKQSVAVAARLGTCSLTFADVAGLAAGDIVILDQPLDAALELALDGHTLASGRCTAVGNEDGFQLEITEPIGKA